MHGWKTWPDWLASQSVFATEASFRWFVRQHRDELIASGQFIARRGRAADIVGPAFDAVVLELLRSACPTRAPALVDSHFLPEAINYESESDESTHQ